MNPSMKTFARDLSQDLVFSLCCDPGVVLGRVKTFQSRYVNLMVAGPDGSAFDGAGPILPARLTSLRFSSPLT